MATRAAQMVVYRDIAGGFRWSLRARNGKVVADSAEAYQSKRKAWTAAARIMEMAATAEVVDRDG